MTTPENSDSQIKHIEDMSRPMIGVRMHIADFDEHSDAVLADKEESDSLIQPTPLVLSFGTVIPKRYTRAVIDTGAKGTQTDGNLTNNEDSSSPKGVLHNIHSKPLVRNSALVVGIALVAVACASFLTDSEKQESLTPLPTNVAASTSFNETTTTLESVIAECRANSQNQIIVERDQNLSQIAAACSITLTELVSWNELTDADNIDAGQLLLVAPPTTVTTTTLLQPPETAPVETTTPETIPVETVPPETAPVETTPPETAPPTTQIPQESYLSRLECVELGGTPVQFPGDGSGAWATLKKYYNLTEYQVGRILKTDIPTTFHLNEITATPVYECMPDSSVILAAAPATAAPTT